MANLISAVLVSVLIPLGLACGASGIAEAEGADPPKEELIRALEVMEDNGVVIVAEGQEPRLVAKAGHLTISALGGQVEFFHPVEDGFPLPAESDSAVAFFAGPGAIPVEGDLLLAWKVEIHPRAEASQLETFSRLVVEDITGDSAALIADAAPDRTDGNLTVITDGDSLTPESYPWVFTTQPNMVVLRISLISKRGETEILLQPVIVQPVFKQQAQQMYGIIHGE